MTLKNASRQLMSEQVNSGATPAHFGKDGIITWRLLEVYSSSFVRCQVVGSTKLVNTFRA
jgi:hypothetical protein